MSILLHELVSTVLGTSVALLLLPQPQKFSGQSHTVLEQLRQDRSNLYSRFQSRLDRTRTEITPAHYLLMAAALGGLAFWLTSQILQSWLLAIPAFFAGVLLVERLIQVLSARNRERFEAANLRAIRIIASSLRTSPSYLHAFEQVVKSPFIDPIAAEEYKRLVDLLHAHIPLETAMQQMSSRTGSADVAYLATVIQVQKELGGDMAKTLDLAVTSILRRRQQQRRQRAAMSQILAQVNLLSVMPFVFVFSLYANNPHHFAPLTQTIGGRLLLLGCLLSILAGGELIRFVAMHRFARRSHSCNE